MKSIKLVVLTVLVVLFFACKKDEDGVIEVLTVAPYHVTWHPPIGSAVFENAYWVWDSSGREFAIQYIQDFSDKYEEGYEYVIKVRIVTPELTGMDQSSMYYLIEVISKTKVE